MDVQTPETPGRLSLRLDVYSPPQVLQIDGRLCHLVLAFPIERDITNSRAPSLHGRYSASSLLRTRPPPSRLRSTSRFSRLYDHWDRNRARPAVGEGFPFLLFRLQDGFTVSPWLTFPEAPL